MFSVLHFLTQHLSDGMSRLLALGSAVILLLGSPVWSHPAPAEPERTPELMWAVDLSTNEDFRNYRESTHLRPAELSFVSEDTIGVLFRTRTKRVDKLDAIFVNMRTGTLFHQLSWPDAGPSWRLMPTGAGEFLVCNGRELQRYSSSSLVRLQSRPLTDTTKTKFLVSPAGTYLLVREFLDAGQFKLTLIESTDLGNATVLDWNGMFTTDVSDRGETLELRRTSNTGIRQSRTVFLCDLSHNCEAIYPDATMDARFLNNDLVLVDRGNGWAIVRRNGNVVTERSFGEAEAVLGEISVSPRFGEVAFQSGYSGREWVYRIHVVDGYTGKYVQPFQFKKKPQGDVDSGYGDFAQSLSPDGSRIAILRGSRLELYRIRTAQRDSQR